MNDETYSSESQEIYFSTESFNSAEIAQGLRDRIQDPVEFKKFSKANDVVSDKWGKGATEALEAFHEKYSHWPGQEEESQQIKDYLGNGDGSRWQQKTLEVYTKMFHDIPFEHVNWTQAAKLVKTLLEDARLEEYIRHGYLSENRIKSKESYESTSRAEKVGYIKVNGETKRGEKPINRPNEDTILIDTEKNIFGVFDGMGGEPGGDQASVEAARILTETVKTKFSSIQDVEVVLVNALKKADQTLAKDLVGYTTATVAKIWEQNNTRFLVWAHIGDSRLFILREGQMIKQLTTDDSEITRSLEKGEITSKQAEIIDQATSETQMNEKMKRIFNDRHFTDGLGNGNSVIKTGSLQIKPGDRVILTSDGIHDNLTRLDMERCLRRVNPARDLIQEAFRYSQDRNFRSKPDDMSAIVIDIPAKLRGFDDFPDRPTK